MLWKYWDNCNLETYMGGQFIMLFKKKNNTKTKQSDYQIFKGIIMNNDNQASMDDAVNNWQVDTDKYAF